MPSLRILYVGALFDGSTALHRMQALEDLGHRIVPVDTMPPAVRRKSRSILGRLSHKIRGVRDRAGANRQMVAVVERQALDLIWIDKGLTIEPETLEQARRAQPACKIVGYSPDDMMNPGNQTKAFLQGLPLYDAFLTTKSYGVEELKGLGCRCVCWVGNGYDPRTHRPVPVTQEERAALGGEVGFIGQWEAERAESLCFAARAGIRIRVWGYTWERCKSPPPALQLENRPLWGQDYGRALCSFDINLCFLRKCNRDLQTTRSIEIPACRTFMLAERSDEHLSLFEEGKEAEFFGSNDELVAKLKYYLAHPAERIAIAERGYRRCMVSGYSNRDRMQQCIQQLQREWESQS